jgi:hypothetical protein
MATAAWGRRPFGMGAVRPLPPELLSRFLQRSPLPLQLLQVQRGQDSRRPLPLR